LVIFYCVVHLLVCLFVDKYYNDVIDLTGFTGRVWYVVFWRRRLSPEWIGHHCGDFG